MSKIPPSVIPYLKAGALIRSRQCRYASNGEWSVGIITGAEAFHARFDDMTSLDAHRQRFNSASSSVLGILMSVLWQKHMRYGECFFTVRPDTEHNWEILRRA